MLQAGKYYWKMANDDDYDGRRRERIVIFGSKKLGLFKGDSGFRQKRVVVLTVIEGY